MDINELQAMKLTELRDVARELEVSGYSTLRKQDLIFEILRVRVQSQGHGFRGGVLVQGPLLEGAAGDLLWGLHRLCGGDPR